jgi:hypothetical protein
MLDIVPPPMGRGLNQPVKKRSATGTAVMTELPSRRILVDIEAAGSKGAKDE